MPESRPKPDCTPFTLDLTGVDGRLSWATVFGNDHPVELEVGSGKGLFLENAATSRPGNNFVGLELSRKYASKAAERVAKRGLKNVRVWAGDAKAFLAGRVPSLCLRAVHVYFPDPWWKARHKKRRVFTASLLSDIERALMPGGELQVASDVEEYFGVIAELITSRQRFEPLPLVEAREPEHEHDYLTNFERKYRIEGRPIFRAGYRHIGVSDA
jgi:tRNA (guanine-N7-)-methyltransferase